MTDLSPRLAALGRELERAVARQIAIAAPVRRRRISPRFALIAAAAILVVPAAAIGADELLSDGQVAQSLPAGTKALIGTDPSCVAVSAGVEYHCTLATPPTDGPSDWLGTVEPTVDASRDVNGGCRSQNSAGTGWECYIGQTAVDQQIISEGFLGQYAPSPGVG